MLFFFGAGVVGGGGVAPLNRLRQDNVILLWCRGGGGGGGGGVVGHCGLPDLDRNPTMLFFFVIHLFLFFPNTLHLISLCFSNCSKESVKAQVQNSRHIP